MSLRLSFVAAKAVPAISGINAVALAPASAAMNWRRDWLPQARSSSFIFPSPKARRIHGWDIFLCVGHGAQLLLQKPPNMVAIVNEFLAGLDCLVIDPARPRQINAEIGDDPAGRAAEHHHAIRQEDRLVNAVRDEYHGLAVAVP